MGKIYIDDTPSVPKVTPLPTSLYPLHWSASLSFFKVLNLTNQVYDFKSGRLLTHKGENPYADFFTLFTCFPFIRE